MSLKSGDQLEIIFDLVCEYVFPHQLLDSSRGTIAVRRGPELYVLDQNHNSDKISIENVQIVKNNTFKTKIHKDSNDCEFLSITTDARLLEVDKTGPSYSFNPSDSLCTDLYISLIPYRLWGNATCSAMRVWIPAVDELEE